jgi:uncharacterized membrane protein
MAESAALWGWIGRHIAPPRFLAFLLLLPAGAGLWHWLFLSHGWRDSLAMGFDGAAAVMLLSLLPLLGEVSVAEIRQRAAANDANQWLVLLLTSVLTVVVMSAITGELAGARAGHAVAIVKLVATLLLIWLFANSIYTLHYAHEYYAETPEGADAGGVEFPGTTTPGYSDFAYFAFTLGMTFQTSDVAITAPAIRRVTLLHCFAAFVFNIGIIAFTINALGGVG